MGGAGYFRAMGHFLFLEGVKKGFEFSTSSYLLRQHNTWAMRVG